MERRGQREETKEKALRSSITLNLPIASILTNPEQDWSLISRISTKSRIARDIPIDWKKFSQKDYLFTHATICCSVETEADGHTIKKACNELVNDNGNAWTNPVLIETFRSFIGAENYLEHCFVAGTLVNMANGSFKPIEEVWFDDVILDRNGDPRAVKNIQIRFSKELYTIISPALKSGKILCTGAHPFWTFSKGEFTWKKASELDPETDKLSMPTGMSGKNCSSVPGNPWKVFGFEISKESLEEPVDVFNLEVEGDHTYCVENCVVHNCQIPELSKGKIIDAIIRPVKHISRNGEIADIFYVDILVATNRRHYGLVDDIENGRMNTLSMGCECNYVQCSRCGKVFKDDEKPCIHIEKQLLTTYLDKNGVERVVSELCGYSLFDKASGKWVGVKDSVKFIEGSWVENPAFKGAIVNHFVSELSDENRKMLAYSTEKLNDVMMDMFKLRVADKTGMTAIRVAVQEFLRRKHDVIAERVAVSFSRKI